MDRFGPVRLLIAKEWMVLGLQILADLELLTAECERLGSFEVDRFGPVRLLIANEWLFGVLDFG